MLKEYLQKIIAASLDTRCGFLWTSDKREIMQLNFYVSSVELKEINKCVFGFAGTMKRLHKTTKSKVVPYFTWFQRFEEESDVFGDDLSHIYNL